MTPRPFAILATWILIRFFRSENQFPERRHPGFRIRWAGEGVMQLFRAQRGSFGKTVSQQRREDTLLKAAVSSRQPLQGSL